MDLERAVICFHDPQEIIFSVNFETGLPVAYLLGEEDRAGYTRII
jgi:hypothetical protein